MRYPIHRPNLSVAVTLGFIMVLAAAVVVLVYTPPAMAAFSCSGKQINPGDDLDAIINSDPRDRATTFCVHAASGGTTYKISNTLLLKNGDQLIGETGKTVARGPALYGVPLVNIRPSGSPEEIIRAQGGNIEIKWVDIAGAAGKTTTNGRPQTGTGAGITAGGTDSKFLVQYVVIHGNDAAGILGAHGRILNSEFYSNTMDNDFLGFNASAVKGITEYEAAFNFVHDEQGNGLWCDVGCKNDPARANGFWAHDNLVVNNNRSGIRYENSSSNALIEDNSVHGNSTHMNRGAVSVRDSQNALIRENVFGAKTISGVAYPANEEKPGAIRASDSGKSSRVDLRNVKIVKNILNGEEIDGCELPDSIVACSGNTP